MGEYFRKILAIGVLGRQNGLEWGEVAEESQLRFLKLSKSMVISVEMERKLRLALWSTFC